MAEDKRENPEEKDGGCEKGSCGGNGGCGSGCGGCGCGCRGGGALKFFLGLLLGLLLAGAGFCLYAAGRCAGTRCSGMKAMSCPMPMATVPAPTK